MYPSVDQKINSESEQRWSNVQMARVDGQNSADSFQNWRKISNPHDDLVGAEG